MPKLESGMRERVSKFLPRALETALLSYHEFSEEQATAPENTEEIGKDEKAKNFKAHHDACKVALAHIELLLKLARLADLPDPNGEDDKARAHMVSLIESAQRELNEKRGQE